MSTFLRYPLKSHRKPIRIPPESAALAELMGILFGDGGISNKWQVVVSLNSTSDLQYSLYVSSLFNQLFQLKCSLRKRPNQNTLVIVATSISVIEFLISIGVPKGNKLKHGLCVPKWIYLKDDYLKFFVRGLIDTDGCIYIHNHIVRGKEYQNLGLCFTSYSPDLIKSVSWILNNFGVPHSIHIKGFNIYLYSSKAVVKYLSIFGSSNSRITNRFQSWRGRIVV